jgi:hypothetical protein
MCIEQQYGDRLKDRAGILQVLLALFNGSPW